MNTVVVLLGLKQNLLHKLNLVNSQTWIFHICYVLSIIVSCFEFFCGSDWLGELLPLADMFRRDSSAFISAIIIVITEKITVITNETIHDNKTNWVTQKTKYQTKNAVLSTEFHANSVVKHT